MAEELEFNIKELGFGITLALSSTLRSMQMYPSLSHPIIKNNLALSYEQIGQVLEKSGAFSLDFLDNEVYVMNRPVVGNLVISASLYREMDKRKVSSILFNPGLKLEELTTFLEECSKIKDEFDPKILGNLGIYHIKITASSENLSIGEDDDDDSAWKKLNKKRERIREKYYQLCAHLRTLHQHIFLGFKEGIQTLPKREIKILKREVDVFVNFMSTDPFLLVSQTLQPIKEYSPYTHPVNTAIFSVILAQHFKLNKTRQREIVISSLLHQVGLYCKETISENYNFDDIFTHPGIFPVSSINGSRFFCGSTGIPSLTVTLTFKQYIPKGKKISPNKIPSISNSNLLGLIFYAAKVYDMGLKIWRKEGSFPLEKMSDFLFSQNLDDNIKSLLKIIFNTLGIFPPGAYVKLNTLEVARVLRPQIDYPLEPKVEVIYNHFGEKYPEPMVKRLGLEKLYGLYPRKICSTLKLG